MWSKNWTAKSGDRNSGEFGRAGGGTTGVKSPLYELFFILVKFGTLLPTLLAGDNLTTESYNTE